MDVLDQSRNETIRRELNTICKKFENERLIILGDFNGHLGFLGTQVLNANGRFVLNFMALIHLQWNSCHRLLQKLQKEKKEKIKYRI